MFSTFIVIQTSIKSYNGLIKSSQKRLYSTYHIDIDGYTLQEVLHCSMNKYVHLIRIELSILEQWDPHWPHSIWFADNIHRYDLNYPIDRSAFQLKSWSIRHGSLLEEFSLILSIVHDLSLLISSRFFRLKRNAVIDERFICINWPRIKSWSISNNKLGNLFLISICAA